MAQTALSEYYLRRSSVTSSLNQPVGKGGLDEPHKEAKQEMLAAYGG